MWPWGHAAVAYLLYSAWCYTREGRPPEAIPVLAVGIGSQLPDLVDKPLAWWLHVLPTGRTLAHSLVVALPIIGVLWWVLDGSRDSVAAFGVGWISHSIVDVVPSVVAGEWSYALFPFWPVLSTPPYRTEQSFAAHLLGIEPTAQLFVELVAVLVALAAWRRDGYPGLEVLRSRWGKRPGRTR